jgi:hypothetical protein
MTDQQPGPGRKVTRTIGLILIIVVVAGPLLVTGSYLVQDPAPFSGSWGGDPPINPPLGWAFIVGTIVLAAILVPFRLWRIWRRRSPPPPPSTR